MRVLLQAVAIVLIMLTLWITGGGRPLRAGRMVKLNRIYTKTGDDGTTGLASRTAPAEKHDLRVESYGAIDEANSCIGLAGCTPAYGATIGPTRRHADAHPERPLRSRRRSSDAGNRRDARL